MDWFDEIMDGLEQLLEATEHFEANNRYTQRFVPAAMIWEAKTEAIKEVMNLVAMVAKRSQPHPETTWQWRKQ